MGKSSYLSECSRQTARCEDLTVVNAVAAPTDASLGLMDSPIVDW